MKILRALLCLPLAAALAGCGGGEPAPPPEPELVDVDMPVDAYLQTRFDRRGPRPVEGISGMVPAHFPAGVPLATPASLIDSGRSADGGYIVLQSARTASEAVSAQIAAFEEGGWRVAKEGTGWRANRGALSVQLSISAVGEATELKIEYRSR